MIPKKHPRYESLRQRELIEKGVEKGITTQTGMIAQGRGEAFDYLLGERTVKEAEEQIKAAAAKLVLAKNPLITVNGNTSALCPKEIVKLSKAIPAKIEINLFYRTEKRVKKIKKLFSKLGIETLGEKPDSKIKGVVSARKLVSKEGTGKADVILVMLEDGDRTEFLRKEGKFVIAVDLNPMSRTAKKANITIVDNVVRTIPKLTKEVKKFKQKRKPELEKMLKKFNNKKNIKELENRIRKRMK